MRYFVHRTFLLFPVKTLPILLKDFGEVGEFFLCYQISWIRVFSVALKLLDMVDLDFSFQQFHLD